MRRSDHNLAVIDKQSIKAFELHDQQNMLKDYFKKIKIKNWYSGDSTEVYMHILAEGSLSLYVFRQVAANSNTNTLYLKPGYYLGMNSQYYKFSPNRWTLFYLIKDEEQRSRMKSVVRSNHLKIREENDLIRAIELYNKSLLSSK
jgi:hypothetical protein